MRSIRSLGLIFWFALVGGCSAPIDDSPGEHGETATELDELDDESDRDSLSTEPDSVELVEEIDPGALPAGLRFVVDAGRPSIVLGFAGDEAAAIGPIERVPVIDNDESPGIPSTFRRMNLWHVAARSLDEVGRTYTLYGQSGALCRARVDELGFLHRAELMIELDDARPSSPARRLELEWERGREAALFVARTVVLDGDCTGARWAVDSATKPYVFAPHHEPSELRSIESHAIHEFRRLPSYRTIQTEWESFVHEQPPSDDENLPARWDDVLEASEVRLFRDARRGRTLVLVTAASGFGCGAFYGRLWAIFERDRDALVLRQLGADRDFPDHLLDVDGDDRLELFSRDRVQVPSETGDAAVSIEVLSPGCPC